MLNKFVFTSNKPTYKKMGAIRNYDIMCLEETLLYNILYGKFTVDGVCGIFHTFKITFTGVLDHTSNSYIYPFGLHKKIYQTDSNNKRLA